MIDSKTIDELDDAMRDIRRIPTVLWMMMETFGFDNQKLSELDIANIINATHMIQDVLYMTFDTITETIEKIDEIKDKNEKHIVVDTSKSA